MADDYLSSFAAQVLAQKQAGILNQERPVAQPIITQSAVVAPAKASLESPQSRQKGGGVGGTGETVTGAVNGVPATLVVLTNGAPWVAI